MSKIEDKAIDLLDKLEQLAVKYTPEVIDAALSAVQLTAISTLIYGFLCLAFIFVWLKAAIRKGKEYAENEDTELVGILTTVSVVAVLIPFIYVLLSIFSVWTWVSLFNPKLGLAHKILGL